MAQKMEIVSTCGRHWFWQHGSKHILSHSFVLEEPSYGYFHAP